MNGSLKFVMASLRRLRFRLYEAIIRPGKGKVNSGSGTDRVHFHPIAPEPVKSAGQSHILPLKGAIIINDYLSIHYCH